MLHDAGRSLATQHTLVDRVVTVALDIANLVAPQMHVYAATTGTHVTGCLLDTVAYRLTQVDRRRRTHAWGIPSSECFHGAETRPSGKHATKFAARAIRQTLCAAAMQTRDRICFNASANRSGVEATGKRIIAKISTKGPIESLVRIAAMGVSQPMERLKFPALVGFAEERGGASSQSTPQDAYSKTPLQRQP